MFGGKRRQCGSGVLPDCETGLPFGHRGREAAPTRETDVKLSKLVAGVGHDQEDLVRGDVKEFKLTSPPPFLD